MFNFGSGGTLCLFRNKTMGYKMVRKSTTSIEFLDTADLKKCQNFKPSNEKTWL